MTLAVEIIFPTFAEFRKLIFISNVSTNTSGPHLAIQANAIIPKTPKPL